MESEFSAPELLKRLAAECLEQSADRNSHVEAAKTMERIYLDFGHQGMYFTLLMWTDVALDAMETTLLSSNKRHLQSRAFIETCVALAELFNPPAAWAGRLVLARADWNHSRCTELYDELSRCGSRDYANQCVLALVDFTVTSAALRKASRDDQS